MTNKIFVVTLHVSEERLPAVLGALSGAATLVSVTPYTEAEEKPKHHHYINGKKNKGISGRELAIKVIKDARGKPVSFKNVAQTFVARGFASNSASPVLSELRNEGVIRALDNGCYILSGTTVKMEADTDG